MSVKALYPGTFDPPTNGHVDLIQRGSKLFDHLTVAILMNPVKNPLFTVEERVEMLAEATRSLGNVSVATFDGLMVEFAPQAWRHRRCCAAFAPSPTTSTSSRWR